jgi:predicted RNase H-like HicB family nuclease
MRNYVGILDGSGEIWGVRFPDLDGCVGAGASPEDAIADATAALRDVAAHKRSGGHPPPHARTLAEVLASGDIGPHEAPVLIPLLLDAGRSVRVNVTIDAGLIDSIDESAKKRGLTRSGFLASAAREKIEAQR